MHVFSGVFMRAFSDFSFLSYIVVAIAYNVVLGKQTILLMEIALDRFSLSVQRLLESCRQFSE